MTDMNAMLLEILEDSRSLGFLGPGPLQPQIDHARAFVEPIDDRIRILDLGSGGGVPGLVLACTLDDKEFVLLDGNRRRCAFLTRAVERLGLSNRVWVELGRAEDLARDGGLRGHFDVVVARSFGGPAVTAECAVGFLSGPGAVLLISEPPTGSTQRWPIDGLAVLGLRPGPRSRTEFGTIQEIRVVEPCPERFPRRVGIPTKRPMFHVEQAEGP